MFKVFKKEMYGLDMFRVDVEDFINVLRDSGFKVEDLGGGEVTTLVIEVKKSDVERLKELVQEYDWEGSVVGPYIRG